MAKNLPEKKKLGRPPVELDEQMVEDLASLHCTKKEIASIMRCSLPIVEKYNDIIEAGYAKSKKSLRKVQWEQAMKGNVQMLIWLGKQYLDQKDRQPDEVPHTILNVQVQEIP